MNDSVPQNGLTKVILAELQAGQTLDQIPQGYRGLRFERLLQTVNSQEATRKLEVAFAILWVEKNTNGKSLLSSLLATDSEDLRRGAIPEIDREWEVAELVAATLIQWIPTTVGMAFVQEAFQRAGGSLKYTLPPET